MYYSLIESILNYGIVVWGNAGSTILSKLITAQKWVIKVILFKNKRYPTELVYKESSLLNINQLYIKSVIRYMLKNTDYKQYITHGINTRNVVLNNLVLSNPRHTICQNHIYSVGPKIYNSLPENLKSKPYCKVKKQITKWIIDNNFSIRYII